MDDKHKIYGMYNRQGYTIATANGQELYFAGNSPHDSTAIIDNGIPLRKIRSYCIQTAKDFVNETRGEYLGVERIEDY